MSAASTLSWIVDTALYGSVEPAGRTASPAARSGGVFYELLDAVEREVIDGDAEFAGYVSQRAPSPWFVEQGQWWPAANA